MFSFFRRRGGLVSTAFGLILALSLWCEGTPDLTSHWHPPLDLLLTASFLAHSFWMHHTALFESALTPRNLPPALNPDPTRVLPMSHEGCCSIDAHCVPQSTAECR
jgi:hypothetical protein